MCIRFQALLAVLYGLWHLDPGSKPAAYPLLENSAQLAAPSAPKAKHAPSPLPSSGLEPPAFSKGRPRGSRLHSVCIASDDSEDDCSVTGWRRTGCRSGSSASSSRQRSREARMPVSTVTNSVFRQTGLDQYMTPIYYDDDPEFQDTSAPIPSSGTSDSVHIHAQALIVYPARPSIWVLLHVILLICTYSRPSVCIRMQRRRA